MDIPGTGADANALERLCDQHAAALWRYAWRLTGDHAHAEDVVQETLLRAWQHPHVLRNGQSPRAGFSRLPETWSSTTGAAHDSAMR